MSCISLAETVQDLIIEAEHVLFPCRCLQMVDDVTMFMVSSFFMTFVYEMQEQRDSSLVSGQERITALIKVG